LRVWRKDGGAPFPLESTQSGFHANGDNGKSMTQPVNITEIDNVQYRYSICTFVTKMALYENLIGELIEHGFTTTDCEYLYIDNSTSNRYDAYSGINKFLNIAKGKYIIVCHQDLALLSDGRAALDENIRKLDRIDPDWGLCGNSGGVSTSRLAIRISDFYGDDQHTESLPTRVSSLDENFIVVRKDANLAVSHNLRGFHLYGTDICIIADILGYNAYVIDFHLRHLSRGVRGQTFNRIRADMIAKYGRALRPRVIRSPSAVMVLLQSGLLSRVLNVTMSTNFFVRVDRMMSWLKQKNRERAQTKALK
jgi:hypothetical protein